MVRFQAISHMSIINNNNNFFYPVNRHYICINILYNYTVHKLYVFLIYSFLTIPAKSDEFYSTFFKAKIRAII